MGFWDWFFPWGGGNTLTSKNTKKVEKNINKKPKDKTNKTDKKDGDK